MRSPKVFHNVRIDRTSSLILSQTSSDRWTRERGLKKLNLSYLLMVYGEGSPLEDAYQDPWLRTIYDNDSEDDETSVGELVSIARLWVQL